MKGLPPASWCALCGEDFEWVIVYCSRCRARCCSSMCMLELHCGPDACPAVAPPEAWWVVVSEVIRAEGE